MKMIKLSEEHYIGVDESEIKDGDYIYWEGKIVRAIDTSYWSAKKITHSTQPIENLNGALGWKDIDILLLSEVKELLGLVDVEKKAETKYPKSEFWVGSNPAKLYDENAKGRRCFSEGYNQALEDNKEKKYTKEDMVEFAMCMIAQYVQGNTNIWDKGMLFESLPKPKTEWEVEFVDGKLKLKQ